MKPILFHLGSVPIFSFGVLMSLAFAVAGWVMQGDFARKREARDLAWEIVGFGVVGGILGARLHQAVYHWPDFVADPFGFLTGPSGLVWYGGVIGGVMATVWPIWRKAVPYASALDTGALGLTIGLAIGRVGCHLSGDGDWGTPTSLPWGVAYVNGTVAWPYSPGVFVHPAPLYEAIALLGIFVLLLQLRSRLMPGALFALYLVLSGLTRLLVEFVRTNPPLLLGLTEAQWTSMVLSGAAALWLWRHRASVESQPKRAIGFRPRVVPKTASVTPARSS
jgi:phosphatidylglycerol:prolipoprotein diacylglycerol transferase